MNVKRKAAGIGTGLFLSLLRLLAKRIMRRANKADKKEAQESKFTSMTEEQQESYDRVQNRAGVAASVQSHHDNK